MTRWCWPAAMISDALRQASTAIACDSSMFSASQVNPSPRANQSTPSCRAIFSSPTFHSPDFRNWITATFQPRASARIIVPNAAVDLPFPSPVLTITKEGARRVAGGGGSVGGSWTGSVTSSRVDETEGVAGRVDVDPPGGPRLALRLTGAEFEHGFFGSLDVVDVEVEMRLLGMLGVGPARRDVVGGELEGDRHPGVRLELDPVSVVERLFDLPASYGGVELGEPLGVGGVQGDYREAGDGHEASSNVGISTESPASTHPSSRTRA